MDDEPKSSWVEETQDINNTLSLPKPHVVKSSQTTEMDTDSLFNDDDIEGMVKVPKEKVMRMSVDSRLRTVTKMASTLETLTGAKYVMGIVNPNTGGVFVDGSDELRGMFRGTKEGEILREVVSEVCEEERRKEKGKKERK